MQTDPITLELFRNALFSIADEMAVTVCRTTYSGVLRDTTAVFAVLDKVRSAKLIPGYNSQARALRLSAELTCLTNTSR